MTELKVVTFKMWPKWESESKNGIKIFEEEIYKMVQKKNQRTKHFNYGRN